MCAIVAVNMADALEINKEKISTQYKLEHMVVSDVNHVALIKQIFICPTLDPDWKKQNHFVCWICRIKKKNQMNNESDVHNHQGFLDKTQSCRWLLSLHFFDRNLENQTT